MEAVIVAEYFMSGLRIVVQECLGDTKSVEKCALSYIN